MKEQDKKTVSPAVLGEMKISVFRSVTDHTVSEETSLSTWLLKGKNPAASLAVSELRRYLYGSEAYKAMKRKLPAATLSATFRRLRRMSDIKGTNDIIVVDIDKADNPRLFELHSPEEVRDRLFELPWVYASSLSVSGQGLFVVIPVGDIRYMKQYVETLDVILRKAGVRIDANCNDITRLRILSCDPDVKIKEEPVEVFDELLPEHLEKKKREILSVKKREYYSSRPASRKEVSGCEQLTTDTAFCLTAVRMCIDKGLCFDCPVGEGKKSYNSWLRHACALSRFGEDGLALFTEISVINGGTDDDATRRKFDEGVKISECKRPEEREQDILTYFSRLKKLIGPGWVNDVRRYLAEPVLDL